jgi:outer membrane protein assembly factor BamE (lipoprotein component of BamABCDE complex)
MTRILLILIIFVQSSCDSNVLNGKARNIAVLDERTYNYIVEFYTTKKIVKKLIGKPTFSNYNFMGSTWFYEFNFSSNSGFNKGSLVDKKTVIIQFNKYNVVVSKKVI